MGDASELVGTDTDLSIPERPPKLPDNIKMKPKSRTNRPSTSTGGGPGGGAKPMAVRVPSNQSQQNAGPKSPQGGLSEDDEEDLNIRVKERDPEDPPTHGRKYSGSAKRLGSLFRDPSPSAAAIKESIKRPLTGLFRRTGSRSGGRPSSRGGGSEAKRDEADTAGDSTRAVIDDSELEQLTMQANMGYTGMDHGMITETRAVDAASVSPPARRNSRKTSEFGRHSNERPKGAGDASPDIPQLEEVATTEFGDAVANAPSVAVNRVATYGELDSALMKHSAFSTLEDIDEDVPWTWDYLYTSICTELREEWSLADEIVDGEDEQVFDQQVTAAGPLGQQRSTQPRKIQAAVINSG